MTCSVFSGTLNLAHLLAHLVYSAVVSLYGRRYMT